MPTAKYHQPSVTFPVDLSLGSYMICLDDFDSIIIIIIITAADMTQLCYCQLS